MTVIIYAGLQMLPIDIYEAAKIDGATRLQEIRFVTVPLLKPILIIALIFRFMDAFRSFDIIYTVTRGGPGHATETMVIRAFHESLKWHKLEIGAVIGILLLIITFIVTKYVLRVMPK
jgi:multiple sugar transport system permease protein